MTVARTGGSVGAIIHVCGLFRMKSFAEDVTCYMSGMYISHIYVFVFRLFLQAYEIYA